MILLLVNSIPFTSNSKTLDETNWKKNIQRKHVANNVGRVMFVGA